MRIREKRIKKEIFHSTHNNKWEKCMFGYVIHLPNATIRVFVKSKEFAKAQLNDKGEGR